MRVVSTGNLNGANGLGVRDMFLQLYVLLQELSDPPAGGVRYTQLVSRFSNLTQFKYTELEENH